MVQGRTLSIVVWLTYLPISIIIALYLYFYTKFTDWIGLISLLVFGGVFVLNGLGQVLKALREPRLKIKNPRVDVENENTKHEIKNLIFDIKNNGKTAARVVKVRVKVKGIWDDFQEIVNPTFPTTSETFDVIPNDPKCIRLGQITKERPKVCEIYTRNLRAKGISLKNNPILKEGKAYQLEICLFGDNFSNKKTYRLILDFSSWNKIGIKLDC